MYHSPPHTKKHSCGQGQSEVVDTGKKEGEQLLQRGHTSPVFISFRNGTYSRTWHLALWAQKPTSGKRHRSKLITQNSDVYYSQNASFCCLEKHRKISIICNKECVCLCAKLLWFHSNLCGPTDRSPPVSSLHGILQARILEWVAMPSSRRSSQSRYQTHVSYVSCIGRWVLYHQHHLAEKAMAPHSSTLGLENPMERGNWWATVCGATES